MLVVHALERSCRIEQWSSENPTSNSFNYHNDIVDTYRYICCLLLHLVGIIVTGLSEVYSAGWSFDKHIVPYIANIVGVMLSLFKCYWKVPIVQKTQVHLSTYQIIAITWVHDDIIMSSGYKCGIEQWTGLTTERVMVHTNAKEQEQSYICILTPQLWESLVWQSEPWV